MTIETLGTCMRRIVLNRYVARSMDNADLATYLKLSCGRGAAFGELESCFYYHEGALVGIRERGNLISISPNYPHAWDLAQGLGETVPTTITDPDYINMVYQLFRKAG